jgi:hypothetical protein
VSQWKTVSALPAVSANMGVVAYKHWLYAIGGASTQSNPSTFQGVLRANVESNDGTIGPWVSPVDANASGALPDNKFGPGVEFISPRTIVVAGGGPSAPGSTAPTGTLLNNASEVMTSQIDGGGLLSPWVIQCTLPVNVVNCAVLFCQQWLFLVGGLQLQVNLPYNTGSGTFVAGETVTGGTSGATLVLNAGSTGATGTLTGFVMTGGPFTNGETMTGGTSGAHGVLNSAAQGTVTGVANNNIYKARWGSDRSIFGPWEIVGQLPSGHSGNTQNNACVWRNEFIYLFEAGSFYKARVNRDGVFMSVNNPASFGNGYWTVFNGPPTANSSLTTHMMAIVNQNEVMIVGGNNGSGTSQYGVFSAHLDGDGSLSGPWHETMSLLTPTDSAGLITNGGGDQDDLNVGNLIFVVGGSTSTTVQSLVQVARYGGSGLIGGV